MSKSISLCIFPSGRPRARGSLAPGMLSVGATVSALLLAASQARADDSAPLSCDPTYATSCIVHSKGNDATTPGGAGDPASAVAGTLTGPLTLTEINSPSSSQYFSPLEVRTTGGRGGDGIEKPTGEGGDGGNGGLAGDIGVTLAVGTPSNPTNIQATVTDANTTNGIMPLTIYSQGGAGGNAGQSPPNQTGGTGGTGGNSGAITASLDGYWWSYQVTRSAVVGSQGGQGGVGAAGPQSDEEGEDGGSGGNAGNVNVTLSNALNQQNPAPGQWYQTSHQFNGDGGVLVQSIGGQGGAGGAGHDEDGSNGGNGGNGGTAGNVTVTVNPNVNSAAAGASDAALWALSEGGSGGAGGSKGGSGGDGGTGSAAGSVGITFNGGTFQTQGLNSPGVLAQSIGGVGGNGGAPASHVVGPNGGAGEFGGAAGTVTLSMGQGASVLNVTTVGSDPSINPFSPGILAQSIGGGGGSGASASGIFAVGGNGGNAVAGNTVTVDLLSNVSTNTFRSEGVVAQSIGGGGGSGGDATGTSVGMQMVVGGTGGAGGAGGTALLTSEAGSVVTTAGDHSPGLEVQSIGGGGGSGGAAYSVAKSAIFGASVAVGGSGGDASNGGLVNTSGSGTNYNTNAGQVWTKGADSYGILGQSIGGGGGVGGASTATAHTYGSDEYPNVNLTAAVGGTGGAGGSGNSVFLGNTGLIVTQGSGADGILGQSIGGGGGVGGDASASGKATGGAYNIAATLALGGSGTAGGDGGTSTAANSGIIVTAGESAYGILAQSTGGGGGAGGSGDAKATTSGGSSLATTLSMGGSGAPGGNAHSASATNIGGAIITLGDGAVGIASQAIGGGGGRAGGAAGSASGGDFNATLKIGGSGGGGGDSYADSTTGALVTVSANNLKNGDQDATILTFGADATGILAQSIGGGGGIGGKTATGLGTKKSDNQGGNSSSNTQSTLQQAVTTFTNDAQTAVNTYNNLSGAIDFVNGLLGNASTGVRTGLLGDEGLDGELDDLSQSKGETEDDNESSSITLKVGVGGTGGSGGAAGAVSVTNQGEVATVGHHSDAILAQSIGGGGGKGGAASTATTASDDYAGYINVGGAGGAGGNGGNASVTNTGTIITEGSLSNGIVAQSIAGGGGIGGASASSVSEDSKGNSTADDGAFKSLSLSIGGNGNKDGLSGQVNVTSSGAIQTKAHDAIGILAQSIAGGGGIIKSMATDLEGAGGSASSTENIYGIGLTFGGAGGSVGSSGGVNVITQNGGTITTHGDDSYGILAQSISGGGGLVQGGSLTVTDLGSIFSGGVMDGDVRGNQNPDGSSVSVTVGDNITTSGAGAYGVLAQSIGGGGGIAGFTGQTGTQITGEKGGTHRGSGDYVHIDVQPGVTVSTSGEYATAIFAQSLGGGGGRFTTQSIGAFTGTAGGAGQGGPVYIDVGGKVQATGPYATGIFAQSDGDTAQSSTLTVWVEKGGEVTGGQVDSSVPNLSAAVSFDRGGQKAGGAPQTQNEVNVDGTISAGGGDSSGTAIYSQRGYTAVTVNVTQGNTAGTIIGNILLNNGGGTGEVDNNGGTINSGTIEASTVTNNSGSITSATIDAPTGLVNNSGTVTSSTLINALDGVINYGGTITANTIDAEIGGVVNHGGTITANTINGQFINDGVFDIRNVGETQLGVKRQLTGAQAAPAGVPGRQAQIVGDYVGTANSKVVIGADFSGGKSDQLLIDGSATIAGKIDVRPTSLRKSTVTVVSSTGPLTLDPALQSPSGTHLFDYQVARSGNTLQVTPEAHFTDKAAGLGRTELGVAGSLQNVFDSGGALDAGFADLARVQGDSDYAASLRSVAGQGLGAFGAFRISSSRWFSEKLYTGCRELQADLQATDSCGWARVNGNSTDQDAGRDTAGYHADAYTVDVGGQVSLGERLALVASIGAERSQFHGDDLNVRVKGDAAVGGVGLNYVYGPWEFSGAIDGSYGWYRSTRLVTVGSDTGTANAKPRQWQVGGHVRAAYSIPFNGGLYAKPFADAHVIRVVNNSFTEDGTSPFRLAVDGRSDTTVLGALGMEFGAHIPVSGRADFHPYVSAAAEFDQDAKWNTTARFADQPTLQSFDVRTAGPGTVGRFSVGADLINANNLSFSLSYDPQIGQGYTSQAATARVSYRF